MLPHGRGSGRHLAWLGDSADLRPGPTAIVVLGSGAVSTTAWDQKEFSLPDAAGAARVLEAFRVYALVPDAWVISSGGPVDSRPRAPTTGGAMGDTLTQLGIPSSRLLVEHKSRNTRDEAVFIAPLLRSLHEWVWPSHTALVFTGNVVHEFLGLGFYAVRGWLG